MRSTTKGRGSGGDRRRTREERQEDRKKDERSKKRVRFHESSEVSSVEPAYVVLTSSYLKGSLLYLRCKFAYFVWFLRIILFFLVF